MTCAYVSSRLKLIVLVVLMFLAVIGYTFALKQQEKSDNVFSASQQRVLKIQTSQMGLKPWEHHAPYAAKVNFNSAVFNQLLYFDKSYKILPGIVRDWNWVESEKSYILSIDPKYRFSNDRPLKPEDIEFAIIKRFITNKDETNRVFFKDIIGTDKLKRGQKFKSGMCEGLKVLSKDQIKITLKQNNPTFLHTLGALTPAVAPVEDFADDLLNFKVVPRGTGPYKVVWSDPDSSLIRLERKEKSDNNKSLPKYIEFYNHGSASENNVDIATGGGVRGTKNDDRFQSYYGHVPTAIQVFDFNYQNKYCKDKLFRKAISLILDREEIAGSDYKPVYELIPSSYYGRTNKKLEHNRSLGVKILKENYTNLINSSKPIQAIFHGSRGADGSLPRYLFVIQSQLQEAGLDVKFKTRDWTSFRDGEKDLIFSVYGMVTSFVDPLSPFAHYMPNSPFKNHTDVDDQIARKLFEEAGQTSSLDERAKLIRTLSGHFQETYRQIPIMEINPFFIYRDKVVELNDNNILFSTIDFNAIEMK